MGIRGKLVTSTVVLAFFVSAAPVTYSVHEYRKAVYRDLAAQGTMEAQRLGGHLAILAERLGSINHAPSVSDTLKHPEIARAFVLDPEGFLILDGTAERPPQTDRLPEFDAVRAGLTKSRRAESRLQGGLLRVSAPIVTDDELRGFVHLAVSTRQADLRVRNAVMTELILFGSMILLGAVLAFLMSIAVTRPVVWMLRAANAIKSGNYGVRVPVKSSDELGRLSEAINDVAGSLKRTTVSKNYVNEILQSMADTLLVVDTDAMIVTVNRASVELLGYSERQLVGQPASLICVDEGYQLTGARLQHLLGEESQQDHELLYRTSDGRELPISFSGSPIRDHSDTVVGYVCIGKDITERKQAEREREELNKQLVDTSRQAGMAEVATGVLHNVGNVLNSVNMSASVVTTTVRNSKLTNLGRATAMLCEHSEDLGTFLSDDPKGRQLPPYLEKVAEHLGEEQTTILQELTSLTKNINHIKDIIATQQSYSKVTGVLESVDLGELLDEALRLNAASLERHRIRVDRDVQYVPLTRTDKHQILQVLVNLITNARDAMEHLDGEKVLTISLDLSDEDRMVRLSVRDNGLGIARENLTRIFKHGFTTKKKGHGFGLHSAALTAKELGGSLEVDSEGPGTGAMFTLSLPLEVAGMTP
ncbi:MAG: sensor histidine kinase [Planctomycetota bacterium]